MKKLCIISPDTIALPLCDNTPETLVQNNTSYLVTDKCVKSTAIGKRAENFAKFLSNKFDVTVLIPDLNFPGLAYIKTSEINYRVKSYCYKDAQWSYSQELSDELNSYDIVIIQTTAGIGFDVVSKLNKKVFVVVDAWVPLLVEFPASVSYHNDQEMKKTSWNRLREQYSNLLKRANLLLYANNKQKCFYEGQLYLLDILSVNDLDYNNKKLLKVPYGIEKPKFVKRKKHDGLKLLWYGAFYPWYDPLLLIDSIKNHNNISIDFFGAKHPRYTNYFKTQFDIELLKSYTNIHIIEEYSLDDPTELFSNYDACIMITKDWIENKYSHRVRVLEVISRDMPLLINSGSSLLEEHGFLIDNVVELSTKHLLRDLEYLSQHKDILDALNSKDSTRFFTLFDALSWKSILTPLQLILETI